MMKALLDLPESITVRLHKIPATGIPEHAHARRHVIWVISGRGHVWVDDAGEMELSPGVFVYIPSGASHRFENLDGDLEIYTVSLPPEKEKGGSSS